MIIYDADDPLVLSGVYDREGYKPGERARIEKAKQREEREMSKKRKPNGKSEEIVGAAMGAPIVRKTTFPSNGAAPSTGEVLPERVPIGEAMRRAVEQLGEVTIDDQLAPAQLRQLGEIIEDITRREAAFNIKNDEAKTARKALESAMDLLKATVREFTHPTPLPLFDAKQRESDMDDMLDADEKAREDVTGTAAEA